MAQPGSFNLDIAEMIEEACNRAGFQAKTGYHIRQGRRSLNLLSVEWSNRGLNLWTINDGGMSLNQGQDSYSLPADTIDLLDITISQTADATNADEYNMARISFTTWMQITNKTMLGRPVQYFVRRLAPNPVLTVWPVPDQAGYSLRWWRMTRILDASDADTTMSVPSRFLEAMTAGLAFHMAMTHMDPKIRMNAPSLKAYYAEQLQYAQEEDRDRAGVRLVPRVTFGRLS